MSASSRSNGPRDNQSASVSDTGLKVWSCIICRRRKVRCDRRDPCSNCTKANIECHYPVTGRVPRRSRDPSAYKSPAQKQSELLSRLRRLETVVIELAGQVEDGTEGHPAIPPTAKPASVAGTGNSSSPGASHSDARSVGRSITSSTSEAPSARGPAGSEFDEEFGRLVVDKDGSLHVGNRFWSVFCEEVDHIFEAMHDVTESIEPNDLPVQGGTSKDGHGYQSFIFGNNGSVNLDGLNPLPSQMLFIWQTYVDNVDPFLKVLHVPSVDKIIRQRKGNFSAHGVSMEPLLFAICLATITSMEDESVALNFNVPKKQLITRYRLGTEQALSQAEFLATKDIVVVQAFVIYLTALFYLGAAELAWPLVGSLLRLAKSLKLHRNDGAPNSTPLEVELRRRLWWHICFLDSKAQKPGTRDLSLSDTSFDTELPSAVDDADLSPGAVITTNTQKMSISMIPCLFRCELWRLVQTLQANSSEPLNVRLQIYYAKKVSMTETYLNHLRPEVALERYVQTMSSLFFAKAELVIHKSSSQSTSEASVHAALKASITIINDAYALITDPAWAQWRWQLAGHVPWHAIGVFLSQACRQPWGPESELVWTTTRRLLDAASEEVKEDHLWGALMNLIKATEKHRGSEMARRAAAATAHEQFTNNANQWHAGVAHDPTQALYKVNGFNHSGLEPQAIESGRPTMQQNGGNEEAMEGFELNIHGLQLDLTADPTLWSLPEASGDFGQAAPMNLGHLSNEGMSMDWDSWNEPPALESLWDIL